MAGVKGRSGGARKNSGGARPGAGRKKKVLPVESPNAQPELEDGPVPEDMLELLQAVATGKVKASTIQVRAAIAAVQYTHTKKGDGGKKEEQAGKAKDAGNKFAPTAAPRLAAAGGKRV